MLRSFCSWQGVLGFFGKACRGTGRVFCLLAIPRTSGEMRLRRGTLWVGLQCTNRRGCRLSPYNGSVSHRKRRRSATFLTSSLYVVRLNLGRATGPPTAPREPGSTPHGCSCFYQSLNQKWGRFLSPYVLLILFSTICRGPGLSPRDLSDRLRLVSVRFVCREKRWLPEVGVTGKALEEKSPLGILFAFKVIPVANK